MLLEFSARRREVAPIEAVLYFPAGSTTRLTPASQGVLEDFLKVLEQRTIPEIRIEGHADREASERYNMTISRARAESARAWIQPLPSMNEPSAGGVAAIPGLFQLSSTST